MKVLFFNPKIFYTTENIEEDWWNRKSGRSMYVNWTFKELGWLSHKSVIRGKCVT